MGMGGAAWCTDSDSWAAYAVGCEQTVGSTYCGGRICQVCLQKYCRDPTLAYVHFHATVFDKYFAILFLTCFIFLLYVFSLYAFQLLKYVGKYLLAFTVCLSLITGCCYKFLENPAYVKNGTTKDLVFNLLGVMVKKYNYGLGERRFVLVII